MVDIAIQGKILKVTEKRRLYAQGSGSNSGSNSNSGSSSGKYQILKNLLEW